MRIKGAVQPTLRQSLEMTEEAIIRGFWVTHYRIIAAKVFLACFSGGWAYTKKLNTGLAKSMGETL